MLNNDNFISQLKWSFISKLTVQIITWFVTFYVISKLGVQEYGIYAIISLFVSFILMVGEGGIQSLIIKSQKLDLNFLKKVFGITFLIHFTISISIYITAPLIAEFYNQERLSDFLKFLSLNSLIICFSQIPSALILKELKIRSFSIYKMVSALSMSLSSFIFVYLECGIWSLVWAQLISSLIFVTLVNYDSPFLHFPSFRLNHLKEQLIFCLHLSSQRWLLFITQYFDILIIGKLLGTAQLGTYSVANNLSSFPRYFILQTFNYITFPAISGEREFNHTVKKNLLKALNLISFMIFPISFGISVTSEQIILSLLGNKWNEAIIPLSILSLTIPFKTIIATLTEALNASGAHKQVSKFQAIMLITTITLVTTGATIGLKEAAYCVLISTLLNSVFISRYIMLHLSISYFDLARAVKGPLIGSTIMFCVLSILQNNFFSQYLFNLELFSQQVNQIVNLITSLLIGILLYSLSSLYYSKNSINYVKKILISR